MSTSNNSSIKGLYDGLVSSITQESEGEQLKGQLNTFLKRQSIASEVDFGVLGIHTAAYLLASSLSFRRLIPPDDALEFDRICLNAITAFNSKKPDESLNKKLTSAVFLNL